MYRILYVDDEVELLEIGKLFLETDPQIRVDTLTSANAALSLLESETFDAIISDYQMPGMNGIDLLKRIRASDNIIPFILFTGRGREEVVIQALNEGVDFYLQKGGEPEAQFAELLNKIRYAINRRQAESILREKTAELDRFFNSSPDLLCIADTDGYLRRLNPEWERTLGYPLRELEGTRIFDLVHPEDLALSTAMFSKVPGQTEILSFENRCRHRDGTYRWLEWRAYPHQNLVYATAHNITNRRQAETKIRASEEKYRQIVETAIEGIWSIDADFVTVFVNRKMADLLGYTPEEMIGKAIMEFMDPADLADNNQKRENRIRGISEFYERKLRRKDGSYRWFGISTTPLKKPDGSFAGSFAMLTDITDRKYAEDELKRKNEELGAAYEQLMASEEELRENLEELAASQHALKESESKYRRIVETAYEGIWVMDATFATVYVNQRMADMLGCTIEEMLGKPIMDFMDPGELADNEKKLTNRRNGINEYYERKFQRKDRSTGWFGISVTAMKDPAGRFAGSFAMLTDITDRKYAEDELKRKNEELRASYEEITATEEELRQNLEELTKKEQDLRKTTAELGNQNNLIITLLDTIPVGIFMVEAPSGKPILANQEATRLLGRGLMPDATGANLSEVYGAYLLGTIEKYPSRKMPIIRGMHGETSYVDDMVVVRPDGTRAWLEIFGTPVRDSENRVIASLVSFLDISDRKKAEAALRQANQKLNLLSSVTRHDITNQVTSLKSYVSLIRKKEADPSLAEYLRKVTDIVQRIDTLIRFTKEYENIGVSAPVWQNVRDLVETISVQTPSESVTIMNEIPDNVEIFADPLAIKVFYNLIDNAISHGETISTIRFFVESCNDDYILVCEDNGRGIPGPEKEMIFERGYGKNTGLGLALCREILDITGITIQETGRPGKGARFEMAIPKGQYRTVP